MLLNDFDFFFSLIKRSFFAKLNKKKNINDQIKINKKTFNSKFNEF